jgi:hypothetical protein
MGQGMSLWPKLFRKKPAIATAPEIALPARSPARSRSIGSTMPPPHCEPGARSRGAIQQLIGASSSALRTASAAA